MTIGSSRPRATLAAACRVLCLSALFIADLAAGAARLSAADQAALRESGLAKPEIAHLYRLLDAELMRAVTRPADPPSHEIHVIMKRAIHKGLDLGDVSVPLHQRLVERKRRELIAAVRWARSPELRCDDPSIGPEQLLDTKFQHYMLDVVLRCRRHAIDYVESEINRLNRDDESSIPELKLPTFVRRQMVAQARESTERQAASMGALSRNRRDTLQAIEDLFKYMEFHPAHLEGNLIVFDNSADRPAGEEVYGRFVAALETAQ